MSWYDKVEGLFLTGAVIATISLLPALADQYDWPSWVVFVGGVLLIPVGGFIVMLKEPWPIYKPVRMFFLMFSAAIEHNDEMHERAEVLEQMRRDVAAERERDRQPGNWRP